MEEGGLPHQTTSSLGGGEEAHTCFLLLRRSLGPSHFLLASASGGLCQKPDNNLIPGFPYNFSGILISLPILVCMSFCSLSASAGAVIVAVLVVNFVICFCRIFVRNPQ